jgi:post-segregation antitoxin (ccd killing protein)
VQALLDRAADLDPAELRIVSANANATPSTATAAAMSAAVRAAVDTCRDDAWRQANAEPCCQAAVTLLVRDLLDAEHYQVLAGPWVKVLGPLHPDDVAAPIDSHFTTPAT